VDVLLVRAGALGDVLLLRRAVAALRDAGHRVRLLAPSGPGRALVGAGPSEVASLTPLDGPEMARLMAGEPASAPLADGLRADAVLALTESADLRTRLRPFASRVFSRSPHPTPGSHASIWLAAPARGLGGDPTSEPATLVFSPEERQAAQAAAPSLSPGFLAIHPGSGSATKNWPANRFAALVDAHARGRPWLLVIGPADDEAAAPLRRRPGVVPVRDVPIRVLGGLLAHAGLYVGNDSGVSHLAAAAGAPTLTLFGPTDPKVWAPVGPLVETIRSPDTRMEGLDLAVVQAAAARLRAG
jgi:ADP-heptose:LPS heptosyltransferase